MSKIDRDEIEYIAAKNVLAEIQKHNKFMDEHGRLADKWLERLFIVYDKNPPSDLDFMMTQMIAELMEFRERERHTTFSVMEDKTAEGQEVYACSNCLTTLSVDKDETIHYCPFCGSLIDWEENSEKDIDREVKEE